MTSTSTVIDVTGDGYARGLSHGEQLRERVQASVGNLIEALGGPAEIERFIGETDFLSTIDRLTPDLGQEIRGIATGADLPLHQVLAHNLMDEHWWWSTTRNRREACSLLAISEPSPLIGQTMDLPTYMDGSQFILRSTFADGSVSAVLSSAGLIGLCGSNSHGLGICVNALSMLNHSPDGLPVAFVLRGALAAATSTQAINFITSVPHASGQHYAIVGPTDAGEITATGIECSAGGAVISNSGNTRFGHTNHPLATTDLDPGVETPFTSTFARYEVVTSQADAINAPEDLMALLHDRTGPICVERADTGVWMTFGAIVTDLRSGQMRYSLGPPTESTWHTVQIG
jgi:predicted choloylglycine hydrolase